MQSLFIIILAIVKILEPERKAFSVSKIRWQKTNITDQKCNLEKNQRGAGSKDAILEDLRSITEDGLYDKIASQPFMHAWMEKNNINRGGLVRLREEILPKSPP